MKIEIRNLTKRYGDLIALDHLTLHVPSGMYGLLGPNGAGKTTLMKIMATVMYPTEGTILVNGYDVTKNPEEVRKRIGYLPQTFGFYPNVRVGSFLEYVGVLKGMNKKDIAGEVSTVLEMVNLGAHKNARIRTLSGGMKQRLGIAQAFLGDPEILIVDEPTSGLDPEERVRFRKVLAEMSIGRTVILSTHIIGDIEASCSELCVLRKGAILYRGAMSGLTEYARKMIWDMEVPLEAYSEMKNKYNVLDVKRNEDTMHLRVMHPEKPEGGESVEPNVELGYFCILQGKENSQTEDNQMLKCSLSSK